jgi:UDP-glucose 4-epimerase
VQIVITGASGFLGRALTRRLVDEGIRCLSVSRKSIPGFLQVGDYAEAPAGDVLIHLAEINDRGLANRLGTACEQEAERTLAALLGKGYGRVIYASSAVLYGDGASSLHRETDPVCVVDSYTKIKFASENAVLRQGGVAARLTNLYGPGMAGVNVLSHILRQLGLDGPISLQDIKPVRDFLWIDDVTEVIVKMAHAKADGIFNVGSGVGTSIRELAAAVLATVGQPEREIVSVRTEGLPSHIIVDISKTIGAFDWRPSISLHEGIRKLVVNKLEHV